MWFIDKIMTTNKSTIDETSSGELNLDELFKKGIELNKKMETNVSNKFSINCDDYCLIDDIKELNPELIKQAQNYKNLQTKEYNTHILYSLIYLYWTKM